MKAPFGDPPVKPTIDVRPYDGNGWHAVWENKSPRVVRMVQLIVRASGAPSLVSVSLVRGDVEVKLMHVGEDCRTGVLAMIGGLSECHGLDAFYGDAEHAIAECEHAIQRAQRANAATGECQDETAACPPREVAATGEDV